jgi:hypothetical protein
MEDVFAAAAQRWFAKPRVVTGFLSFVTETAASGLRAVVPNYDSYDWKYGLEESLIAFLHTCWELEQRRISADPAVQTAFLSLLACVVSRGSHAAIALFGCGLGGQGFVSPNRITKPDVGFGMIFLLTAL